MKKCFFIFILIIILSNAVFSQWEACNNGLNTSQPFLTFAINGNNLFIGTLGNGIYLTTDNGTNWQAVNQGLTSPLGRMVIALTAKGDTIYAGGADGIYFTSNNGTNWNKINTDLPKSSVVSAIGINGNNIYIGTINAISNEVNIFLSTNNGTNWNEIDQGLTSNGIASIVFSGNNIFAGGIGGVFISTDNGTKWNSVNNGLNADSLNMIAFNGNNLFAATNSQGIFLTTDNGANWNPVNQGLTLKSVSSIVFKENDIYACTINGGVFHSSDNGSNWKIVNKGLSNANVETLKIFGDYLFAGTDIGVYKVKRDILDDIENPIQSPFIIDISPNPATDNISISFSNPELTAANISICNSFGVEIMTKTLDGSSINISTEGFPPGIYYCTLNTGINKITKNFVIVR